MFFFFNGHIAMHCICKFIDIWFHNYFSYCLWLELWVKQEHTKFIWIIEKLCNHPFNCSLLIHDRCNIDTLDVSDIQMCWFVQFHFKTCNTTFSINLKALLSHHWAKSPVTGLMSIIFRSVYVEKLPIID